MNSPAVAGEKPDIDYLRQWIGRTEEATDIVTAQLVKGLRATLFQEIGDPKRGDAAPFTTHWCLAPPVYPMSQLSQDGHPTRGGFLPPVPLSNRMWAGGRIVFIAPIRIGSTVRRRSAILNVEHKHGRSGDLVFVTVLHQLSTLQDVPLLREEHDLVYRQPAPAGARATPAQIHPPAAHACSTTPDSTMLFRYSALTFNGHRIHYDADYCREVEGYPGLVIHGPLVATLLAAHAERTGRRPLRRYDYRCLAPAFLGDTIALHADVDNDRATLRATLADGATSVSAEATYA